MKTTLGNAVIAPLIIAEVGTGHGGSLSKAKELIDAAAASGADSVKFQIVYADEILHPSAGDVPLPGGARALYQVFKALEAPPDFYAELKAYTESKRLLFLATPFGLRSAACLKKLQPVAVKIASPELNYIQLVREIAGWGIPTFISTGVSKLADIEQALEPFGRAARRDVCLLHCVTAYPAPPTDYNVRLLTSLGRVFGVATGVSDHSEDAELVPAVATALGAVAIEKHFCLDRDDGGLDDPIALPPADFERMVTTVRRVAYMRRALEQDEEVLPKLIEDALLTDLNVQFTSKLVNAVLGDGVKRLAPAEKANYGRTNRSLHAVCDIAPGELFTESNTAILRTEKVLRPGLPPEFYERVLGRAARVLIPAGEGIRLEDI